MDSVSIKYEEKKLEDTIGEAWLAYNKKLRGGIYDQPNFCCTDFIPNLFDIHPILI
jgi:hypothetical protein